LLARIEDASVHPSVRVSVARGRMLLGELGRARPLLDTLRERLLEPMKLTQKLDLVRALTRGYACMPLRTAIEAIRDLTGDFRDVTDSWGTNSHYCLSVLHFTESLVLGLTADTLVLGDRRRFAEDDEHLIRRRLYRDLPRA
jgi:hypothetical protein